MDIDPAAVAVGEVWKPAEIVRRGPDELGVSARFTEVDAGTHTMTIAVITRAGSLYSHSFVIEGNGQ